MRKFEKLGPFPYIDPDGETVMCFDFRLLTSTDRGFLDCTEKQTCETVLCCKNISTIIKQRLNKRTDDELKKVGAKETAWPKSPS